MPIQETSSFNPFLQQGARPQQNTSGAFAAALHQEDTSESRGFIGVNSSPIKAGQSLLSPDLWPERWNAGLDAGAEKIGLDRDTLKEKFASILEKATATDGFSDPKSFLKSLTADEREILQVTQGLAVPISARHIDAMSAEGALNLMLPRGAQRDWNTDGIYTTGAGHSFRFPTDSTPAAVKAAWAETIEGMSDKERMLAEGKMMIEQMSANARVGADGKFAGFYEPGEPEYRDAFGSLDFSALADKALKWNEYIRPQISEEQYQRDYNFWTKFGDALDRNGVSKIGAKGSV
ncbi:MAG: hypothetical protein COB37_05145 [Kordiimonadales bacterium]|nr:MAG: hypothetical protein COB37_05145 [Kordiimonadales bacterium]